MNENSCRWKHISPTFMYLRLTTFTKTLPKMSFHPYFFAIFSRSGAPPTTLLPDGALTYPQLPATVSNVCTTDARLGSVGRLPPPPPNKNPGYSGGSASRLLSWSFLSHVAVCILNAYSVNTIHTICSVLLNTVNRLCIFSENS